MSSEERPAEPRIAVYPGSFDPVTNGHLDLIERASRIFDRVIVAILTNPAKDHLFDLDERLSLLRRSGAERENVMLDSFSGLLVEYARTCDARAIIRGLRAVSDFEYEFQMALMNRKLYPGIEAVFLMPKEEYSYVSSKLVKEIYSLGGRIPHLVPPPVEEALQKRFSTPSSGEKK